MDSRDRWNDWYAEGGEAPAEDIWLASGERFLGERSRIIEFGCGLGYNSRFLHEKGHDVVSTDFAPAALERLAALAPGIETRLVDLRDPLPFPDGHFSAGVADLCLHYFDAETTTRILREISRILAPEGFLFCRVNSTLDVNHGAGQGESIEPGLFEYRGMLKRFFTREDIHHFFCDWSLLSVRQYDIIRHTDTKNLIEVTARKMQGDASGKRGV